MPSWITRTLLAIAGILMLVGAGIGVYHAGVEWHFWEGPATCATIGQQACRRMSATCSAISTASTGPSCTDAALRVLGLSFAGWNVIASLILAAIALAA